MNSSVLLVENGNRYMGIANQKIMGAVSWIVEGLLTFNLLMVDQ